MQHLTRFVLVSSAVCAALFGGCATEEIPQYGDPAKVVGSVGATGGDSASGVSSSSGSASSGSSSSSSGGACPPDAGCTVSFMTDVFPILEMKARCTDAACHAPAPGAAEVPVMAPGDAKATLQVLLMHKFLEEPADAYIVPCDPMASKMMCNLKLDPADGTNMFGKCAPTMPKVSTLDAVDDAPLSLTELNKIAEWIQCGALDN